jgi:putative ATP-dependent endonuclease of OLD family
MTKARESVLPPSVENIPQTAPTIYYLSIERFRGIQSLVWMPNRGVNVILGGGDTGKTTILDAIGLLFSPTNLSTLSDTDYYVRNEQAGFVIEAVVSLPSTSGISEQIKPNWPWIWNGTEAIVPTTNEDDMVSEPVYRLRLRGTDELELVYEIVQPDGSTNTLSVSLRRAIGLVRLTGDDRNDRDLRLVQGSALDRLLSDKTLRSRLTNEFSKNEIKDNLSESAKETLLKLDDAFVKETLPQGLDLAITGGQGLSVAAMIGLTARFNGIRLPLANWGAGTRRLSALTIAEQNQGQFPITLVDEIERGLEPYRQRTLMEKLQNGASQVFLTSHSSAVVSAVGSGALWYLDHSGNIGKLDAKKLGQQKKNDPEMFLARLAIVAEGITEVGFVSNFLEKIVGTDYAQRGIHVSDGKGHDSTLLLLEALADARLSFGGFVDNEKKYPEKWANLKDKLGALLFQWKTGCLEENVIGAVADDKLESLINDPSGEKTGYRLRSLADRLNITGEKDFSTIKGKAGENLRKLILEAALGIVPEGKGSEKNAYKAHAQDWFKKVDGGWELAEKVITLNVWTTLKVELLPFFNKVRKVVGLNEIEDLRI